MKLAPWLVAVVLVAACEARPERLDGQGRASERPAASTGGAGGSTVVSDAGAAPVSCNSDSPYAYLHGDVWPLWYNFRVCCDAEHKALWRCERLEGKGSPACAARAAKYKECLEAPNGSVCPNWGVCCAKASNGCEDPKPEHREICTTDRLDYDSPEVWGTYHGMQWSSPQLHRFTTLKIKRASGEEIAAFSSNPGDKDAYMEGIDNHGVGPEPQGHIQPLPDKGARFGSFACVRLPADEALEVEAIWINEFAHTCKPDYWGQPDARCRTDVLALTPRRGRHYLLSERGLEELPGCDGPPAAIAARLPAASCSTSP